MDDLVEQAELLRNAIKSKRNEIDNSALVLGIINELDFFIENVVEEVNHEKRASDPRTN